MGSMQGVLVSVRSQRGFWFPAALFLSSCSYDWSVREQDEAPVSERPSDASDSSDVDGGIPGIFDAAPEATSAGEEEEGPPPAPEDSGEEDASSDGGCDDAPPDPETGIFVSPEPVGVSLPNCGAPSLPCSTIALGLQRAAVAEFQFVYLDNGTYRESVELLAGIVLRGGFSNLDGVWRRQCSSDRAGNTLIVSPSNVGVRAEFDGEAAMETLTIRSEEEAQPGESEYGVFARGTATRLVLRDVIVEASAGGDGLAGESGALPQVAAGTCAAADGRDGAAGSAGQGAALGTFDRDGYSPADGGEGSAGAAGNAGSAAPNAAASCVPCVDPASCVEPTSGTNSSGCSFTTLGQSSCGKTGAPGCGGVGGGGGSGGKGGGSSIAVFVVGASVRLEYVSLLAGEGGAGGSGGAGAKGASGAGGAKGEPGVTCSKCQRVTIRQELDLSGELAVGAVKPEILPGALPAVDPGLIAVLRDAGVARPLLECRAINAQGAGTQGGAGGAGGSGGEGGAGAAGHSYAILRTASGDVSIDDWTVMSHAEPRGPTGNGPAGAAADIEVLLDGP